MVKKIGNPSKIKNCRHYRISHWFMHSLSFYGCKEKESKNIYLDSQARHWTRIGMMPDCIRSSIGGFLSLDKSFLKIKIIILSFNNWKRYWVILAKDSNNTIWIQPFPLIFLMNFKASCKDECPYQYSLIKYWCSFEVTTDITMHIVITISTII